MELLNSLHGLPGLGTIFNFFAIIAGGLGGMLFGRAMNERLQKAIMAVMGVCVLFIGIGGGMEKMLIIEDGRLVTTGTMMMIISLGVGIVIGEFIDIEGKLERFGEWLKKVSGNDNDNRFLDAFITASLTVCIGAMAVVGSIQDSLYGNISILVAKGILDFVIIMIMTSSMGIGSMFSAIPVAVFQGSVTLLAKFAEPLMIPAALNNLSYVGSIMIFCVGLNLLRDKKIPVANMLPALIIAILWR